jgi:hypothetical protein
VSSEEELVVELTYGMPEDINKFVKHVPLKEDLTLQLLKGHLLVEEIVRDLLRIQLLNPDSLSGDKGASFDCHQCICLVEATRIKEENIYWVWSAAKKLNKIRNDLAHSLEPAGIDDRIKDLIELVGSQSPHFKGTGIKGNIPIYTQVHMAILGLATALSSLKQ